MSRRFTPDHFLLPFPAWNDNGAVRVKKIASLPSSPRKRTIISLRRKAGFADDVEHELHALIGVTHQTQPELLDVLVPFVEPLTKR